MATLRYVRAVEVERQSQRDLFVELLLHAHAELKIAVKFEAEGRVVVDLVPRPRAEGP